MPARSTTPASPGRTPGSSRSTHACATNLLAVEQFDSILEAKVLAEDWRIDYNLNRPHSSLGYLAPVTYAATWPNPELS